VLTLSSDANECKPLALGNAPSITPDGHVAPLGGSASDDGIVTFNSDTLAISATVGSDG